MSRSLRVLMLCQNDFGAPTEKQALGFAEQLAERGHSVLILISRDADTIHSEGADRVPGVQVHWYRFRGPRLRAADRSAAREFAPDLIHAFNPRIATMRAAAQLRRATRAPVLVHFEDDEWSPPPPGFPGEAWWRPHARRVRRLAWPLQPSLWWGPNRASLSWARRNAAAFDALTPVLAEEVRRRMRADCAVVGPITPTTISGEPSDLPQLPELEATVVAFTGTVIPVYLPDFVLGLRGVAEAQRRGHRISFVHAGETFGFDGSVLAREAGLAEGSAHFIGYRPFREIAGLLQRADILIQSGPPSEFNRLRLPSKLQTYLASGTPTITFAVGFGELLSDREEVLKTYTGEPGELAERIEELITDPALAARVGEGGRRAAARLFDPKANTDALLAYYRDALAQARSE